MKKILNASIALTVLCSAAVFSIDAAQAGAITPLRTNCTLTLHTAPSGEYPGLLDVTLSYRLVIPGHPVINYSPQLLGTYEADAQFISDLAGQYIGYGVCHYPLDLGYSRGCDRLRWNVTGTLQAGGITVCPGGTPLPDLKKSFAPAD